MTFEQWQRRPVHLVQCFTFSIGRTLLGWHKLRVVYPYKFSIPTAVAVRRRVAEIVRQYRAEGLTRRDVRNRALEIIANPGGIARRVDMDAELREMGQV